MEHNYWWNKIDGAEDVDLVMPIYNLIELFRNKGRFMVYSKNEATSFDADVARNNNFKSFEYKAKLLWIIIAQPDPDYPNGILKNATIVVPLKNLSNFWRLIEMLLINCKVELKFKWKKHCVLAAFGNDNTNDGNTGNMIFTMKHAELYVPVA